ncbi:helix-turn-helix transcriptional regulator [Chryseobacterium suipulveris]|uniref:Helix-turn-helix transcriptional regulator n=1 Tax=Chryseobacterium suipulveris TaxID=2929800 RepID=A0ABY4BZQ4_9FLAO|nr:helix-turn-helix domain-containing protein [Chryseobacterium suipulveris]UOE41995.1 helix-turn-helix transcriptional regulator [Chryseobacterium suipulveris]
MITFRSNCPLARSLDILGDKWTLLILRDISAFGKTTFKELSQMKEKIATNTLSDRLEKLTSEGMLTKTRSSRNKLVFHYNITEKGLELLPVVQDFINWSMKYLYEENEMEDLQKLMATVKIN